MLVLPKMQIPIPLFTFRTFLFVASVMHVLYSYMSLVNSLLQLPQYLSAANDTLTGLASLRRHFRSSSRRRIGRPAGVRGLGRTTVAVPASVSPRSVFRAAGSRRRILRRKRRGSRSFLRRRRASRRTPSRSRRPNFQRRRMKMRPFNKAPFTISKFLSSGAPLPKMTFCRLRFYSQKQVSFDGTSLGKAQRVIIPNSIADQWLHGMQDTNPQGGTWLYLDVFKTFYRYYLCLGSKTKITIQRMLYPNFLTSITPSITASSADQVFSPTTVGYWYVRCNYIRNGEQIGRAISPDGLFTENWRTLQQFMSDPTITYFKDSGVGKRVKTGFVMGAASPGFPQPSAPLSEQENKFYVEYESYNKTVTFSVGFSYKRHFQDFNPLKNGNFIDFDNSIAIDNQFRLYVGYIAFAGDNVFFSQTPVDRDPRRLMSVDTNMYIAVTSPVITPQTEFGQEAIQRIRKLTGDEAEVLEYAINRNPEGLPTPELERELEEELDNMLEEVEEENNDSQDNGTEEE